jgi:outer membrane protein TolC
MTLPHTMINKATLLLLLLLCHALPLAAQQAALDWSTFREQLLRQHPAARQANLFRDQASAALLRAKGGFDPKTYADFSSKNFDGKTYFRYTEAGLKLPTWGGLELKSNYNLASGNFLNSESTLPTGGQAAAGFNWTLGQGLMIDERRAGLRQARIGLESAAAERLILLNDFVLDAAKAYWNWTLADNQLRIYEEALRQARIRHEGLRESFVQGDKPAIDTLETFIQLQNRLLDVNFTRVELQNAALALSNFVWVTEEQIIAPESLPPSPQLVEMAAAAPFAIPPVGTLAQQARSAHPELRYYRAKLENLEVERRLKNEKRKPVLDLNYNLLGAGWEFFPTANNDGVGVLANDIKWGVNFSYPLLNRKARGDLQITQIKIAQTDNEFRQKRQLIETKVQQYDNDLQNLRNQMLLYRDITANYRRLLDGELEKFNLGESSIFLINTREQRWLDAQVKYLKLLAELRKAEAGLLWSAGVLAE